MSGGIFIPYGYIPFDDKFIKCDRCRRKLSYRLSEHFITHHKGKNYCYKCFKIIEKGRPEKSHFGYYYRPKKKMKDVS
jgi:hypothetical protein